MSPDQIERLKREYTDKYVQVTGDRPDHARFRTAVGQVKTINMSGRALVEFADFLKDIGWYDIDLDFLKVVDKPAPVDTEKAVAKSGANSTTAPAKTTSKSAAGGKLSPLERARQMGAGKSPAPVAKSGSKPASAAGDGKKLSPLEMARQMGGSKTGSSPASDQPKNLAAKPSSGKLSPLEILKQQGAKRGDEAEAAIAKPADSTTGKTSPAAAKADGEKLSPIEVLRQMGGAKGGARATESKAEEQAAPATDVEISAKASEPIPPEATPAPLKWAREMESQRGPAKEAGYPTTADIYEMSQGKKPLGWRPKPPADNDKMQKSARVQGGRITSNHETLAPLSTADIWAISRGERRAPVAKQEVAATPSEPEVTEPTPQTGGDKLSTADILAQLRAQGGGNS